MSWTEACASPVKPVYVIDVRRHDSDSAISA